MPTDPKAYDEIARLAAARDEALRRYAQHLAAIQIKHSRWNSVLSRHRSVARSRLLAAAKPTIHAR